MPLSANYYSVTDINRYVKSVLSNDENLRYIYIKGEISNFKRAMNGHFYFSLKDKDCMISASLFNNYAKDLTFEPKNGDEVIVLASVDVYPARGTYQLIVYKMEQLGLGDMLVELEKLKRKLAEEGLFDPSKKRPINIYPKAIGVITAKNSAAIVDITTNIQRRFPVADIYVFYSAVQGDSASKELIQAFKKTQEYDLDTIIIGRGGGASEDLSPFNDEELVRTIANSKIPVISAVGHEIDSTLVDYVADKRASTPTGAAELATVDQREIKQKLSLAILDMQEALKNRLIDMQEEVLSYKEALSLEIKRYLTDISKEISFKKEQLESLNPKNVLKRGYSILQNDKGQTLTSVKELKTGDKIKTIVADGEVVSTVENIKGE